ncbi:hypothetical protein GA0070616_0806 [Micromonospora nigra]|uniref:Uncharacterized protein n=1 Tax=Micromonospora nigra TaxID=145857 RepID=A0A1C6REW7_9ACTN|nr:hypothetical protein GA0070616_0806 [Micromonospora nigra]
MAGHTSRVELVDGAIQVTPSPTLGHQDISSLLSLWLRYGPRTSSWPSRSSRRAPAGW